MSRQIHVRGTEQLSAGDHVCWPTSCDASWARELRAMLSSTLRAGERVLYFFDDRSGIEPLADRCASFLPQLMTGQILATPLDVLVRPAAGAAAAREKLKQFTAEATAEGFSGVCAVTELSSFCGAAGAEPDSVLAFEEQVTAWLSCGRASYVAHYDTRTLPPAAFLAALTSYPHVLLDGDLCNNPAHVAAGNSSTGSRAVELERVLGSIRSLTSLERRISDRSARFAHSENALAMLESIIDSIGDGVFVVNEHGNMLFCNKASERILGYGLLDLPLTERVRLIGNFRPDTVTPFPPHELPIARAMRGESVDQVEIFIRNARRPNGVFVSVSGRPLRDRFGILRGGVCVIRDITERKAAAEEQQRVEDQMFRTQKLESLGVLAGGIAHDFNNLLMGVLGNADLALGDAAGDARMHTRIGHIRTAARRLAELTNQLLAYSGQGSFVQSKVRLSRLVEEMADLLRPAISKKASLRFAFESDLPPIEADATQVRQVVMNLITNASDALGEEIGVVAVSTGTVELTRTFFSETYVDDNLPEGTYVYLEVADTGSGMDEETLRRIFDPFFTTKFTGRGLGLAAVLGIVRRHRGALRVESRLGVGTTFRVVFPAVTASVPAARSAAAAAPAWQGGGTILVVDDEDTVRAVACEMLERSGFRVLSADTGSRAVLLFEQHAPDIAAVLLDLTMPDMNGEEVYSRIRSIHPAVKVIVSSGYHEHDTSRRFAGGAVTFLQKPYGREALVSMLRKLIAD